jgi:hypothetical protein
MGTQSLFRLFRGNAAIKDPLQQPSALQPRLSRRSSGFAEFARYLADHEGLRILDLGPTSPANIQYLTSLGHKVYNEDVLLASTDPALMKKDEFGRHALDVNLFLADNLQYDRELFDAVLCWDTADYLPEALIKPLIDRIHLITQPKGLVLAFFHTRDGGPDAPSYRYHVAEKDVLNLQPVWKPGHGPRGKSAGTPMFRLQRVFANRQVENLLHDFASLKFFLARDNIREVLAVR